MIKVKYNFNIITSTFFLFINVNLNSQQAIIYGNIDINNNHIKNIKINIENIDTIINFEMNILNSYKFDNLNKGKYKLSVFGNNILLEQIDLEIISDTQQIYNNIIIKNKIKEINEIVISGTLKEVKRIESSVPVEVYNSSYFKRNPTPNIFDALQNINGVKPQLNCNICNTGDIHINGLEGPNTMILIDGMPIVSGLASVYGLAGIPNSLIERIEIVKGPASSLYGSEAVGGLINVITKMVSNAPKFSIDAMRTTWAENNIDIGFKINPNKKIGVLTGINYFLFNDIIDKNGDNFTDITLQNRISIFQKWRFQRPNNRIFNLAARFYGEDRWGGDIRWKKEFRGGDSIYGESIYTKRWELIGKYQLPLKENFFLSFSLNSHIQDSRYGKKSFNAEQNIGFLQLNWDKTLKNHDLLLGFALKYLYYNDNTLVSKNNNNNFYPGIFIQDEISISSKQKLLLGCRYDYNIIHKNIITPRLAYKLSLNSENIFRINAGVGFRVVSLFSEEHAALSGTRDVVILNELKPEKSYNINLNYLKKIFTNLGTMSLEFSSWYTYFTNKIVPDYTTDITKIIYNNLNGYAESKGISLNTDFIFFNGLKIIAGITFMEVNKIENGIKTPQMLTEKFTGTWSISYAIQKWNLNIDYTGNIYGPMPLPTLGNLDPRSKYSPTWSIQNIQFTFTKWKNLEIYAGLKNILNFLPTQNVPFLIPRTNDPFNKQVVEDENKNIMPTVNNPYALRFDPSYVYAPNQDIRGFLGVRFNLK